jgi:hypothetical protein
MRPSEMAAKGGEGRGGWTTMIHAFGDCLGRLIAFEIAPGQLGDRRVRTDAGGPNRSEQDGSTDKEKHIVGDIYAGWRVPSLPKVPRLFGSCCNRNFTLVIEPDACKMRVPYALKPGDSRTARSS